MDRISKLPSGIIETILCLLPIQQAARTSILSREWRYHWIKISKLAFDEDTFQISTDGDELSVLEHTFDRPSKSKKLARCKLFYAIYKVLLMHQCPIHEFTLCMGVDGSCVEIDRIILHLSKKNTIKILKLDFNGREKTLLHLLSGCPLLKKLTLNSYPAIGNEGFTVVDLFERLPVIEYLSVWFYTFLCFGPDRLPKELPTKLVHLKYLCIEYICFYHIYGLPFLFLLIRSSPNLKKLKLKMADDMWLDDDEMGSVSLKEYSDILLEHLNELEIFNFTNTENELDFVELILAKSPVIMEVRIFLSVFLSDQYAKDEKSKISKILLGFPCASPVVKVIVK